MFNKFFDLEMSIKLCAEITLITDCDWSFKMNKFDFKREVFLVLSFFFFLRNFSNCIKNPKAKLLSCVLLYLNYQIFFIRTVVEVFRNRMLQRCFDVSNLNSDISKRKLEVRLQLLFVILKNKREQLLNRLKLDMSYTQCVIYSMWYIRYVVVF